MKNFLRLCIAVIIILALYVIVKPDTPDTEEVVDINSEVTAALVEVYPISHATMALNWEDHLIYVDPVGGAEQFALYGTPDLILVTDIHGDHFNLETLQDIAGEESVLIVPEVVAEELPIELFERSVVLSNDELVTLFGITITAIPMYNLPESDDSRHTKGRGNGYVLEHDGYRVYIAGDTADIPEMRALTDIDLAFVPMNLPYTMTVDAAADAVIEFAPRMVYPYHYRGQDGLSDVERFKELVNAGNPAVEVILADWYPAQ